MGKRRFHKNELRLPVYNTVRQLYEQFCKSTRKLPINIKRGPIAEAELWMIELLEGICFADDCGENEKEQKLALIRKCEDLIYKIMIRVRTLRNLNLIPISGFSALIRIEKSVNCQLDGWLEHNND